MGQTFRRPRVVVGVDRSLNGLAALRTAVDLARCRDMPLYAVRAVAPGATDPEDADDTIAAAFDEALGAQPTDLEIHRVVMASTPAAALRQIATGPQDLIVVGTSGKGLWHTLAVGSLARSLLHATRCPVLAVPAPGMARTVRRLHRRARRGHDPIWEQLERESPGRRLRR